MSIKTSTEIAGELFDAAFTVYESDRFEDGRTDVEECSADYIREQMRAAIEADRAQREVTFEALDNLLAAWENYGGDVSAFMQAWLEHLNNGTEIAGEFSA